MNHSISRSGGASAPSDRRSGGRLRAVAALAVAALTAQTAVAAQAAAVPESTPAAPAAVTPAFGAAEAQEASTAHLLARLQKREIEILDERTDSTSSYALPDGSTSVRSYTGPIRVKDAAGRWQPVDTSLVDTGTAVRPKRAAADVTLSDGGSGEPLVEVARGTQSLGIGWAGELPAPELSGSTATYKGAVKGGDLVVTALKEGFSHSVVLHEKPKGPVEYRIPVEASGLTLKETADKRLRWDDARNKAKATAPAPVMWDSSYDRASGDARHIAAVDVQVEKGKDGEGQVLVLKPDTKFLADPNLVYPVTIDPTDSLTGPVTDTWIQYDDYLTSQRGSTELKAGTYNGAEKARSFLQFNADKYKGKVITDTDLRLYSSYSSTCTTTNSGNEVRRITGAWDPSAISWSNQPATTTAGAVVNKAAKGYSASCPAGHVSWDIDAIVQAWADGQPNHGVRLAAVDETDVLTWRRYHSANQTDGSHNAAYEPSLTVTYNTKPGAATPLSPLSGTSTNDTTPTLTGKATDADGNTVQLTYEIWTPTGTAAVQTGKSAFVASGANAPWTAATALAPGSYKWRAAVHDGTSWNGTWSAWQTFTVDTAKPAVTAVSSADFPAGQWSGTPNADGDFTGSFSFTPPAADVKDVQYRLDSGAWITAATTGAAVTRSLVFKAGAHTLTAHTRDAAGNVSADTVYSFSAGKGAALVSPAEGDRPARRVTLASEGRTTYTGVRYQYRHGEADAWKDVPVADVRRSLDGATIGAWPLAVTGGKPASLYWNITATLANDGPVDIRAVFGGGTTTDASPETEVVVDRNAGEAPTAQVGPGSVNLLTGDYKLSAKDVQAFDVAVNRTASSRANPDDSEGQSAIFGPGWVSSVSAETSGSGYTQLRKTSATSVEILDADGGSTAFTAKAGGGWEPEAGAGTLTLTGSLTGDTFTLKDTDATVTVFAKAGTGATTWTLATSAAAVDDSTVAVVSETVTQNSATVVRPRYLISPTEAVPAATCQAAPSTKGCRVVEFVYATATTATGWSTAADFGDIAGQVKEIKLWATDPGAASARDEVLSRYRYDKSGRLRQQWNPHYSQATQVQYSYDAAGRVFWMMPGTEQPWNFHYGKAGSSLTTGEGMLLKVTRPTLKQGTVGTAESTATSTVVYDVPLTGAAAPRTMDRATVGAWAQNEVPTDATAVFPADSVPASSTGADLAAGGYGRASVTYIDANGRETNTATPGGGLTTTEYDAFGNEVSSLSAANRDLALGTGPDAADRLSALGIAGLSTAERAERLSASTVYSTDGQRVLHSYGPLHLVSLAGPVAASGANPGLPAGALVPAREHMANKHDEGRPADAAVSGLPTSSVTGASIEGYPQDADTRTTVTAYNWTTGEDLLTRDADGNQLSNTRSTYRADGKLATTSLPASNGTDAGTLTYTYWTAGGTGACAGRPEWAGLLCRTEPAGKVTGGTPADAPTTAYTYNRWGGVATTTRTANGATLTSTVVYDDAGRRARTSSTGGPGTPVPETVFTYDPETGKTTGQTSGGKTISYRYDTLGRLVSYQDGAGNTATTEYDLLDRPVKSADSTGAGTTYGYDAAGRLATLTDSAAGTFTAGYDADGRLVTQAMPGGYRLKVTTDPADRTTAREYTDAAGTTVLADIAEHRVNGRMAGHSQTDGTGVSTDLVYDAAGRLTGATDTSAAGCAARAYGFDANSNRTSKSTTRDDCDAATADAAVTTESYTYDSADRLTGSGRTYDAFGRATTDGTATLEYFTGDLLRSETIGTQRRVWDLDAASRPAVATTWTQGQDGVWNAVGTVTQHFGDDSSNPDWAAHSDGTVTRFVNDLAGGLGAITGPGGGVVLQLANLHGDIAVQLDLTTPAGTSVQHYDEYGLPTEDTRAAGYGWLGSTQVSSETLSGRVLTGARVYDPATGRFLQADPKYAGGKNAYVYCGGDPVGCSDTSGLADYYRYYDLGKTGASDKSVFNYWKSHFKDVFPIPGRPNKITREGQDFTLRPVVLSYSWYFPVNVNSIGKSYLQLGARFGHPDWPGGWVGFDLYKKKGRMKLEIRGHLGGGAAVLGRSFNEAMAKKYWDKLGGNLRKVVRDRF